MTTPAWAARLVAETADGMAGGTVRRHRRVVVYHVLRQDDCPAQPEGKTL